MKYVGQSDYQHNSAPRIGVLLTNLGTPEAPTAKALRPYQAVFMGSPGRRSAAPHLVAYSEWHHPQYPAQAVR